MKKSIIIIFFVFLFFLGVAVLSSGNGNNTEEEVIVNNEKEIIEKIEVVHFHGTRQCWSCVKVGELALKTIEEEFPEEYMNGKIVFLDVNGELLENNDIVEKYQARGSSLFINKIIDGKDNIEEDIVVWRMTYDEQEFSDYFKEKLNIF